MASERRKDRMLAAKKAVRCATADAKCADTNKLVKWGDRRQYWKRCNAEKISIVSERGTFFGSNTKFNHSSSRSSSTDRVRAKPESTKSPVVRKQSSKLALQPHQPDCRPSTTTTSRRRDLTIRPSTSPRAAVLVSSERQNQRQKSSTVDLRDPTGTHRSGVIPVQKPRAASSAAQALWDSTLRECNEECGQNWTKQCSTAPHQRSKVGMEAPRSPECPSFTYATREEKPPTTEQVVASAEQLCAKQPRLQFRSMSVSPRVKLGTFSADTLLSPFIVSWDDLNEDSEQRRPYTARETVHKASPFARESHTKSVDAGFGSSRVMELHHSLNGTSTRRISSSSQAQRPVSGNIYRAALFKREVESRGVSPIQGRGYALRELKTADSPSPSRRCSSAADGKLKEEDAALSIEGIASPRSVRPLPPAIPESPRVIGVRGRQGVQAAKPSESYGSEAYQTNDCSGLKYGTIRSVQSVSISPRQDARPIAASNSTLSSWEHEDKVEKD